jgi:hypothetical protein
MTPNGTLVIIIGDNEQRRKASCHTIMTVLSGTILDKTLVDQLQGDASFKRSIMVQHLKMRLAASDKYIVWDYDAKYIKNRKDIIALAQQANYRIVALVVDTPKENYTMGADAVDYDEGFSDILTN